MSNQKPIKLEWDMGTAYDMFISLAVLHDPEKFGLRGSWAAGVRSRLPNSERELLQKVVEALWPMHWVHDLPEPKDGATVLRELGNIPPSERLNTLLPSVPAEIARLLDDVAERGEYSEADERALVTLINEEGRKGMSASKVRKKATELLELWAMNDEAGEMLLDALTSYQEQFFAEEEARIAPAMAAAQEHARELAASLELHELLEELSEGVRLDKDIELERAILAPSFWSTPLMIFAEIDKTTEMFLYGARPASASLIPGDVVPDALYQALKAMADPTRLRILRYLTEEPATAADLARRLRLRAPTVIHHLDALRLARLVQLTLDHDSKRYAIRREAVGNTCDLLQAFLAGEDEWVGEPERLVSS